jgi:hypothetical protein
LSIQRIDGPSIAKTYRVIASTPAPPPTVTSTKPLTPPIAHGTPISPKERPGSPSIAEIYQAVAGTPPKVGDTNILSTPIKLDGLPPKIEIEESPPSNPAPPPGAALSEGKQYEEMLRDIEKMLDRHP